MAPAPAWGHSQHLGFFPLARGRKARCFGVLHAGRRTLADLVSTASVLGCFVAVVLGRQGWNAGRERRGGPVFAHGTDCAVDGFGSLPAP